MTTPTDRSNAELVYTFTGSQLGRILKVPGLLALVLDLSEAGVSVEHIAAVVESAAPVVPGQMAIDFEGVA